MTYTVKVYHPQELMTYKECPLAAIADSGALIFSESDGTRHETNLPFEVISK